MIEQNLPRIAIFGVGAMGCLFGAKLAPYAQITLVGNWSEQVTFLQNNPLTIHYPQSKVQRVQLNITTNPEKLGQVDFALILTKSTKTQRVVAQIKEILTESGLAVTLQNGLENYELLQAWVGHERATLGITAQGATVLDVGEIRYGGVGDTHLATRPNIQAQVQLLADLFAQADLRPHLTTDIQSIVWGKLAVNAAINPLSALLRMPNGQLVISDWARDLLHDTAREVQVLAQAQGISLPYSDAARQAEQVARLTAKNKSSMLQDVLRRTETEIEQINGAIVRLGERHGVATPVNSFLYRMIKALDEMC